MERMGNRKPGPNRNARRLPGRKQKPSNIKNWLEMKIPASFVHAGGCKTIKTSGFEPDLLPRPEGKVPFSQHARLQLTRRGDDGNPRVIIGIQKREDEVVVIRGPDGGGLMVLIEVGQYRGELVCWPEIEQHAAFTGFHIQHVQLQQQDLLLRR